MNLCFDIGEISNLKRRRRRYTHVFGDGDRYTDGRTRALERREYNALNSYIITKIFYLLPRRGGLGERNSSRQDIVLVSSRKPYLKTQCHFVQDRVIYGGL